MTGNDADGKRGGDRPPTLDEWRAACAAPFLRGGEIDDVSLARRFGERGETGGQRFVKYRLERAGEHRPELAMLRPFFGKRGVAGHGGGNGLPFRAGSFPPRRPEKA